MTAAVIILIILVGAAIAFGSYYLKKKRRDELAMFATQYSLAYQKDDPYGLVDYPFRLFAKGDGRGCENVLSGPWHGQMVKEADYWYYDESTDSQGHRTKTYHQFSTVVVDLGLQAPYLSVDRENLLTLAADHLGLRDIDFESEQFDREFNVKCADEEFAFKLIDARMEQFLLDTGGAYGVEFGGSSVLVYCRRLRPMELVPLLGTAKGFVDHIPRLVWNEYGTAASQGDAGRTPAS